MNDQLGLRLIWDQYLAAMNTLLGAKQKLLLIYDSSQPLVVKMNITHRPVVSGKWLIVWERFWQHWIFVTGILKTVVFMKIDNFICVRYKYLKQIFISNQLNSWSLLRSSSPSSPAASSEWPIPTIQEAAQLLKLGWRGGVGTGGLPW